MMMMGIFTADRVEYGAYKTGRRNEGVTFSVQTFSTKLGSAFAGAIALFFIGAYGYDGTIDPATGQQSAEALNGIWLATSILPVIGLVLSLILFTLMYKFSEEGVAKMTAEMAGKREIVE